ncbi:MAG: hypothetical protein LC737_01405, partial [Chloroflexi bacterium]|nr:hypothetical protein [Chloroflexota bacterium]
DSRNVYAALAATVGTSEVHVSALGVYHSTDGGETWRALSDTPQDAATTRLVIDPTAPRYVYGLTEDGAWRSTMPE